MLALGAQAGLGITFVDALDATLPEAAPILATMRATGPTGNLGLGALACTQSHARAWRALLDSGAEFGLILEDDVILSADFTSVISALIAAKPDFDLIKLEVGSRPAATGCQSGQGPAPAQVPLWPSRHLRA